MNAVWNSYGQLCGCPEIFKKSCKFFCRELDIRVTQIMNTNLFNICCFTPTLHFTIQETLIDRKHTICFL